MSEHLKRADKLEKLGHRIPAVALRRLEHVEPGWADGAQFVPFPPRFGGYYPLRKKPSWLSFGHVQIPDRPEITPTLAARIGKALAPVSTRESGYYGHPTSLWDLEHPVIKQGHGLGPDHPSPESWNLVHHGLDEAKRTGSMHGLLVAADHLEEGNTKTGVNLADFLRHLTRANTHDLPRSTGVIRHSDPSWPITVDVHHQKGFAYLNHIPFHHSFFPKRIDGHFREII